MKKIFCIIGVLFVFLITDLKFVKADEIIDSSNYKYEYNSDGSTLCITGYYGNDEIVVIPSELNGTKVTKIARNAFYSKEGLRKVVIKEGITSIGEMAFRYCSDLKEIELPSTLTQIGDLAFEDNGLTNVVIPEGVTSIPFGGFRSCKYLTGVKLPDSLTRIGVGAFQNCTSLKTIELPGQLNSIGGDAFTNCSSIKEIKIPASVTTISNYSYFIGNYGVGYFTGCSSLENIDVDVENTSYYSEEGVLYNSLKTQVLCYPKTRNEFSVVETATSIEAYACNSCNFETVIIPQNIRSIGYKAFSECDKLEKIFIYDTVSEIIKLPSNVIVFTNPYSIAWNYAVKENIIHYCITHTPVLDVSVMPTCTTGGKTEGSHCSECGEIIKQQETIKAYGHKFTNYVLDNNATCTKEGTKTAVCDNGCGTKDTVVIKGSKKEHTWNAGVVTKEATCIEKGEKTYTCIMEGCGATKIEEMEMNPTNHKNTEIRNKKKSTYIKKGYSGDIYCKDCGLKIKTGKQIPTIEKKSQKIKVATSKKISAKKVKKKTQSFKLSAKSTSGSKVKYKLVKKNKYIKFAPSSGKITVKKGTKKGTYKIKVKMTVAGNNEYKSYSTTKTITIKVK